MRRFCSEVRLSAAAVEPQAWTRWIQRSSVDLPRSYSRITSARGFPESTRATICRLNSSVNCLGCLGSRMGPPFLEGPSDSHPTVQFSIATSKKVARIPDGGGWRARGESVLAHPDSGGGYACLHVAVDDFSRVAYAELLPDERKGTCAAFMRRALRFYAGLGLTVERVMTDNGPGYRSGEFNELLAAAGARHVYTRPYSPWQNGKVERMNRTIAQEWQYGRAWESEAGRASALPAFIERYNWERPHSACGGLPPMSRIVGVNNLLAHNS